MGKGGNKKQKRGGKQTSSGNGEAQKSGGVHKAHTYTSKRPVGGKGVFVTCVRGKESRAVGEMYDLLEEVADRLYPKERLDKLVEARKLLIEERDKARQAALSEEGPQVSMEQDDDSKAEGDEETSTTTTVPPVVADDSDDDDDDLDIEASIQKELAALKSGRGGSGTKVAAPDKGKGKAKERPRFQNIETGTECLCFIAIAWPYDPVELVEAIVSEVQETGQSRTRYVQRLSPTTVTCHSNSIEFIEQQSARLIEQAFTDWAAANGKTSVTYQIEPTLRSHTAPLSRGLLLPLLGSVVSRLSDAPTLSSPCPSRPIIKVRGDLKNPDLVVLPTVLKNCYALSVVEGKLWKGKKFNLEQIAMEVRRQKGAIEDEEKEKERLKKAEQEQPEKVEEKVEEKSEEVEKQT
ncbi:putative tRNA acetyltransferase [Sporobolomyces salmoneus]|uniref:putative tRNA acetyltransferase n=1 Tax=Sporobolomyces salmoneus TaxID=183962 RepID=UPI0031804FF9